MIIRLATHHSVSESSQFGITIGTSKFHTYNLHIAHHSRHRVRGGEHTLLQPPSRLATICRVVSCQSQTNPIQQPKPTRTSNNGNTNTEQMTHRPRVSDGLSRVVRGRRSRAGDRGPLGGGGPAGPGRRRGAQELPREHDGDGETRDGAEGPRALHEPAG